MPVESRGMMDSEFKCLRTSNSEAQLKKKWEEQAIFCVSVPLMDILMIFMFHLTSNLVQEHLHRKKSSIIRDLGIIQPH